MRKSESGFLIAVFCALWAGRASTSVPPITFRAQGPVGFATIRLPSHLKLSVKVVDWAGAKYASSFVKCAGAAMTGGYSSEYHRPDGLVVIDGKQIAPIKPRNDGGIVVFSGDDTRVLRMTERTNWPKLVNAIQTQPILIEDGKIDYPLLDSNAANRVALGKLKRGGFFMIMAYNADRNGLSALTLLDFAQAVQAQMNGDVDWLVNFDGGPSAFLITGEQAVAPANGGVTSYICAEQ